MNEQLRILEMIEKGQITAAEGQSLLEALNSGADTASAQVTPYGKVRPSYKFLKIKVSSENKTVNVNVNIPIRLINTLGGIASKITAYIPEDARKEMTSKGIDISAIDFNEIFDALLSGTLDDPTIVDVEAWDEEHQTMIKVKIYAE